MDTLSSLLNNNKFKELIIKWNKVEDPSLGFNVFSLMSDLYYRENFHSDILKAFLDKNGSHEEGDLFFNLFVKLLNSWSGININIADFTNYEVHRETARIDISIVDDVSRKAIIIENKINNAPDMERQIPRYVEAMNNRNYEVMAIVYLRLDKYKNPYISPEDEEKLDIKSRLVLMDVTDEQKNCLVNNVLKPALLTTNKNDVAAVLKQYISLLEYLDGNKKTHYIMKDFYDFIKRNASYNELISLSEMTDKLPAYFATKVKNDFEDTCLPFDRTWVWRETTAVFDGYKYKGFAYAIDIKCYLHECIVQFFPRAEAGETYVREILDITECFSDEKVDGRYSVHFNNSNIEMREVELYEFINKFLSRLNNIITSTEKL